MNKFGLKDRIKIEREFRDALGDYKIITDKLALKRIFEPMDFRFFEHRRNKIFSTNTNLREAAKKFKKEFRNILGIRTFRDDASFVSASQEEYFEKIYNNPKNRDIVKKIFKNIDVAVNRFEKQKLDKENGLKRWEEQKKTIKPDARKTNGKIDYAKTFNRAINKNDDSKDHSGNGRRGLKGMGGASPKIK